MSVQVRQKVEKRILEAVLDLILADPRLLSMMTDIGDGPDQDAPTRDKAKLLEDAYAGDECRLYLFLPGDTWKGGAEGWVFFVWGNSGWDCVSDYTTNFEPLLFPVVGKDGLQDQMEKEFGDQ